MKTTIKKISILILIVTTIVACESNKQNQLIKLKKERQTLDEKISLLEKEIISDTTIVKPNEFSKSVLVEKAKLIPFEHYIEIHGKLDGEENVQLYPKGQGVVTKVLVLLGSTVKKGQVIATLDAGALEKSFEQAKAQYKLANEMFERQKKLWEQRIGSEVQYLQAKTQKEASEQGLAALEQQLDYMTIKSPIDGSVEDLPLKVGMAVSPAMPVATVINFSSAKVVAEVAEAYGTQIKKDDFVTVFFPDLKKQIAAKITTTSNYINPINRSFKIEVRLNEMEKSFKANMVAVLKIADYKNDKAFAIPINLIQTDSKGNYIYVAQHNNSKTIASKKYIKQGMSYNGMVEIIDGLTENDLIITSGYLSLNQGTTIKY
ncbi:MAG: efflux RND transporter periplasmic adaptor subunit [Marinilabiliaceae bacterium]|nr:efflux RND transporter periplasmic adaptor subunit [Marinilabiliaceae bacterium]